MSEQFTNNASTTLGSSLTNVATTATVASGTGVLFPVLSVGQYFTATIFAAGNTSGVPNEIVRVTARVGDTMTLVRGQEGTVASAWAVGDSFSNYITAAWLNSLATEPDIQQQAGNYGVDAGATNALVVTLTPVPASLASLTGAPIRVKAANTNTGAVTLNVNGLGATAVSWHGAVLPGGAMVAGQVYEVVYDGAVFEMATTPAFVSQFSTLYGVDSGSANAYAVTLAPAPAAYFAGLALSIKVSHTNTGASTLAVGGLATKGVIYLGSNLLPNMLVGGQVYDLVYDGTNFQVINPSGSNPSQYGADTGAANAYVVTLSPAPSGYVAGMQVLVKVANTNAGGASTINVNALGAKAIQYAGAALVAGTLVAGLIYGIVYDGTQFQLLNPSTTLVAGSSGHEILPSGLIRQWGTFNIAQVAQSHNSGVVTFASLSGCIAFPNACFNVVAQATTGTDGGSLTRGAPNPLALFNLSTPTTTGFTWGADSNQGVNLGGTWNIMFQAIGN